MAIKGLSDILSKYKNGELDEASFEAELGKALATDFIPKGKYNELSEAKKLVEANLASTTQTLTDLKAKAGLSDEYKGQIEKLMAENAKAKEAFDSQIRKMKMDTAIESALSNAKARNLKATRSLLDEGKILLNEDGTITGISEQLEAIKKENAFLFEPDQPEKPNTPKWGSPQSEDHSIKGDDYKSQMLAMAGLN